MPVFGLSALGALWLAAVDAPVTSVTVYSDRARVVRTARVSLSGSQRVELPVLHGPVDPSSIRVEAQGAEVTRVDIRPVTSDALPASEARRLVTELERLDDQLAQSRAEREAWFAQLGALAEVHPVVPEEALSSPPAPTTQRSARPEPSRLDSSGWRVATDFLVESTARLQAKLREVSLREEALERELALRVQEARKLGGTPSRSGLEIVPTLSGQGTATLSVSYVTSGARWYPSYELRLEPESNRVQVVFSGRVSQESGEDWEDAALTLSTAIPATSTTVPRLATWKIGQQERFIPTPSPVSDSWRAPPPVAPALPTQPREDARLRERLLALTGRANAAPTTQPAPSRPDGELKRPEEFTEESVITSAPPTALQSAVERLAPQRPMDVPVGLAPPEGWRPPALDANLPASLAGGYALAFPSQRRESVRSGGGERRVPLFSETWPVQVERKLYPALTPNAFLVAELRSPSRQVLPGGEAQLFVGADPVGQARLTLVSPGEPFTLPLGVDPAVRPVRNVKLLTAEKGLIGKDELTEYLVTIEVANPYPFPLPVRIHDQWPLSRQQDVEVKLVRTEPYAEQDKDKGTLLWRLTVPPSEKTAVSFLYTVRHPKGWRLHQNQ
ncbi:mucoidy inhibitor MuiA family protein [Archangium sp.]|uniref:mucoidy inhibitor MuiA family protein n=1 Tax=Archangium sp. TaxID=1872627 RepID=UPI00286D2ADE|nr:mucoidy inhibitor MuiA family protein [Archangium sp.]